MTTNLRTAGFLALAMLGYALMLPTCATRAHAQSDEDVRIVAITTAHESTSIVDARGIWSVLRAIADRHGWSLRTAARSYSPRLWSARARFPIVLMLTESCTRPPRIGPVVGPATCAALFGHVRHVMAGEPCQVDSWGNAEDYRRAQPAGRRFAFVTCAEGEQNRFADEVTP